MSISKSVNTAKERVKSELFELRQKIVKLEAFVESPSMKKLKGKMQGLLVLQLGYMKEYADILVKRLEIWDD